MLISIFVIPTSANTLKYSMDTNLGNVDASFIGEETGDMSGMSVAYAGDVNGDGYDDILIGALGNDEGNYYARRRFAVLKKVVESLGLEYDRLRLSWVSASEGQRFANVVKEFDEKIKKMGPSPLKKKKSL